MVHLLVLLLQGHCYPVSMLTAYRSHPAAAISCCQADNIPGLDQEYTSTGQGFKPYTLNSKRALPSVLCIQPKDLSTCLRATGDMKDMLSLQIKEDYSPAEICQAF